MRPPLTLPNEQPVHTKAPCTFEIPFTGWLLVDRDDGALCEDHRRFGTCRLPVTMSDTVQVPAGRTVVLSRDKDFDINKRTGRLSKDPPLSQRVPWGANQITPWWWPTADGSAVKPIIHEPEDDLFLMNKQETTTMSIDNLKAQIAVQQDRLTRLLSFGDDEYETGAVLTFESDNGCRTFSYAAIKGGDDRWYMTGQEYAPKAWDALVEWLVSHGVEQAWLVTQLVAVVR